MEPGKREEKVGKGPLNGDNGPQLEECDEIVFYSGSGWTAVSVADDRPHMCAVLVYP